MNTRLESIRCAACHAVLKKTSGYRIARCPECNSPNLILTEEGFHCYSVEKQIDQKDAIEIASVSWTSTASADHRFIDELRNQGACDLYFVPVYDNEGLATLRYTTKKYRSKPRMINAQGRMLRVAGEGKIDENTIRYDTKISVQGFHYRAPAVKGLRWGIEHLNIDDDFPVSLVDPLDLRRRGIVLSPTLPWETFETTHDRIGARDVESDRDIVIKDMKLIYMPVWRITTRFQNMVYDAFICGLTGKFLRGTAPQCMKTRATAFSLSFAATAFITSFCLVILMSLIGKTTLNVDHILEGFDMLMILLTIPLLLLVALLSALAAYGWDKFRYVPEIVKTSESTNVHSLGKVSDSWLDKLWKSTLDNVSNRFEGIID